MIKKLLTEIHLMMERADYVYVADEIVKHYGLPTKVKFSNSFRRKRNTDKGTQIVTGKHNLLFPS